MQQKIYKLDNSVVILRVSLSWSWLATTSADMFDGLEGQTGWVTLARLVGLMVVTARLKTTQMQRRQCCCCRCWFVDINTENEMNVCFSVTTCDQSAAPAAAAVAVVIGWVCRHQTNKQQLRGRQERQVIERLGRRAMQTHSSRQ